MYQQNITAEHRNKHDISWQKQSVTLNTFLLLLWIWICVCEDTQYISDVCVLFVCVCAVHSLYCIFCVCVCVSFSLFMSARKVQVTLDLRCQTHSTLEGGASSIYILRMWEQVYFLFNVGILFFVMDLEICYLWKWAMELQNVLQYMDTLLQLMSHWRFSAKP